MLSEGNIISRSTTVTVLPLPKSWTVESARPFLRELRACAETVRPLFVVDCSETIVWHEVAVYLLLRLLEEAMKRNGDVRLAAISPDGKALLEAMGVGHLFRAFASRTEAVSSFQRTFARAAGVDAIRNGVPLAGAGEVLGPSGV